MAEERMVGSGLKGVSERAGLVRSSSPRRHLWQLGSRCGASRETATVAQALLQALVLGVYAMFVGDVLSRKDSVKPELAPPLLCCYQ